MRPAFPSSPPGKTEIVYLSPGFGTPEKMICVAEGRLKWDLGCYMAKRGKRDAFLTPELGFVAVLGFQMGDYEKRHLGVLRLFWIRSLAFCNFSS